MVIDVRAVPEGYSRIERDSSLEAFEGELPPLLGALRCDAEVYRMGGMITVSLRFAGEFTVQCARCLEDYSLRVEGLAPVIIKEEQGRHGPSSDDSDGADFFFDVNHDLVDVSSAIYDEIMVGLPLKPLCSEGCEGVKYEGKGAEGGEKAVDPRWEGLKKLVREHN